MIFGAAFFLAFMPFALLAAGSPEPVAPVGAIASQGFAISTDDGTAIAPFMISLDWSRPQPQITRAIIIFHGKGRDVEGYYRTVVEAAAQAGAAANETIIIAPQFLDDEDAAAYQIPDNFLRWRRTSWEGGAPATAPIPVSSYEIVDAILARLVDTSLFPSLKAVVLAGHSGGAQLLQRYAIVGRAPPAISASGHIHLRFVVANPSSYFYFSDERRSSSGGIAPFQREVCDNFNYWKYGPVGAPGYVDANIGWLQMEVNYAREDVIYLLGTADTDPNGKDLDVSCAAEAEGPTRFVRGQTYYAYLNSRDGSNWKQRMWFVSGVAHSSHEMFTSICGVSALFDVGSCRDQ